MVDVCEETIWFCLFSLRACLTPTYMVIDALYGLYNYLQQMSEYTVKFKRGNNVEIQRCYDVLGER